MTKLKAFGIAVIRTSVVPPTAGFVILWLAKHGVTISSTWVSYVVLLIVSGVWYCTFHGIEVLARKPKVIKWAGIFLGFPSAPAYTTPVGPRGNVNDIVLRLEDKEELDAMIAAYKARNPEAFEEDGNNEG